MHRDLNHFRNNQLHEQALLVSKALEVLCDFLLKKCRALTYLCESPITLCEQQHTEE